MAFMGCGLVTMETQEARICVQSSWVQNAGMKALSQFGMIKRLDFIKAKLFAISLPLNRMFARWK